MDPSVATKLVSQTNPHAVIASAARSLGSAGRSSSETPRPELVGRPREIDESPTSLGILLDVDHGRFAEQYTLPGDKLALDWRKARTTSLTKSRLSSRGPGSACENMIEEWTGASSKTPPVPLAASVCGR